MSDNFDEKLSMGILTLGFSIIACIICLLFFSMGEAHGKLKYEKIILEGMT